MISKAERAEIRKRYPANEVAQRLLDALIYKDELIEDFAALASSCDFTEEYREQLVALKARAAL